MGLGQPSIWGSGYTTPDEYLYFPLEDTFKLDSHTLGEY